MQAKGGRKAAMNNDQACIAKAKHQLDSTQSICCCAGQDAINLLKCWLAHIDGASRGSEAGQIRDACRARIWRWRRRWGQRVGDQQYQPVSVQNLTLMIVGIMMLMPASGLGKALAQLGRVLICSSK